MVHLTLIVALSIYPGRPAPPPLSEVSDPVPTISLDEVLGNWRQATADVGDEEIIAGFKYWQTDYVFHVVKYGVGVVHCDRQGHGGIEVRPLPVDPASHVTRTSLYGEKQVTMRRQPANHWLSYHKADEFLSIDPEEMSFQRFPLDPNPDPELQPGWFGNPFQFFNDLNSVFVHVPFLPSRSPNELTPDFRFEVQEVTEDSVDLLAHPVSDKARRHCTVWRVRFDRSDWSIKAAQCLDPSKCRTVTFEFVDPQRDAVPPLIPDLAGLHEPNPIQ